MRKYQTIIVMAVSGEVMRERRLCVRSCVAWRGVGGVYESPEHPKTLFPPRLSRTHGKPFLFTPPASGETADR